MPAVTPRALAAGHAGSFCKRPAAPLRKVRNGDLGKRDLERLVRTVAQRRRDRQLQLGRPRRLRDQEGQRTRVLGVGLEPERSTLRPYGSTVTKPSPTFANASITSIRPVKNETLRTVTSRPETVVLMPSGRNAFHGWNGSLIAQAWPAWTSP